MSRHPGSLGDWARRAGLALAAALVLAAATAAIPVTPARAGPGSKLETARKQLDRIEARIRAALAAADGLRERIADLSDAVGEQHAEYRQTQIDLVSARSALAAAQGEYMALRERLDERAVQALFVSRGASMELLLEADSFSEVSDRIAFLNQVQAADAALAEQVGAKADLLEARNADLQTALERQASIVDDLDRRQGELIAALSEQQAHLASISSARQEAAALVSTLRQRVRESLAHVLGGFGGGTVSYGKWAEAFLGKIEAPVCRDNLIVLVAWQAAEGTAARFNPLATTLPMPGSTDFNSVGVQNYVSSRQGLEAIHETLLRGAETYGYGAVLYRLKACADAMATAEAINLSSWCRGCAGGAYVTGIVPAVEEYFEGYADTSA